MHTLPASRPTIAGNQAARWVAPGQDAACQRRPGNQRQVVTLGQRDQLVFDAPVEQVVGRLLADVARQPLALADRQPLHHQPGGMRARADVAHFAAAHEVIQGAQGFFLVDVKIRAVDLIEVDGLDAQALQRCFACPQQMIAAVATVVGAFACGKMGFRGDDKLVAHAALGNQPSQHAFRCAFVVDIGGVDEIDTGVQSHVEHALRFFGGAATTKIHHAEAEGRGLDACAGEESVVHGVTWGGRGETSGGVDAGWTGSCLSYTVRAGGERRPQALI